MPNEEGFIEHTPDRDKEFTPIDKPNIHKVLKVKHPEVLSELVKAIEMCPMDDKLKMLMRLRVWGDSPHAFNPLTLDEVAVKFKVRLDVVKNMEDEAKHCLVQYLRSTPIIEVVNEFNADKAGKRLLDRFGKPL